MLKRSAGILPYKLEDGEYKFLLAHPGGPYWQGIDKWSICKGEILKGEKCLQAAIREFQEETGQLVEGKFFFVGSEKQKSGKLITIFSTFAEIDISSMTSNTFFLEYPKGSGLIHSYVEMDAIKWFTYEEAYEKIFQGQRGILNKLKCLLDSSRGKI